MAKGGMAWSGDNLASRLLDSSIAAQQYLARTTEYYTLHSETYAKGNAPWTDRSGNARSGLASQHHIDSGLAGSNYNIDIFHRVSYGIWLETRHGGRYGIINRTVQAEAPQFFAAANKLMATMFARRGLR